MLFGCNCACSALGLAAPTLQQQCKTLSDARALGRAWSVLCCTRAIMQVLSICELMYKR